MRISELICPRRQAKFRKFGNQSEGEPRSGNQNPLAGSERASYRLLQIIMDNPPEAERKVGADVDCGDDLENR